MKFLSAILDGMLDRSLDELIGAVAIAGIIALVAAAVFAIATRKTPTTPTFVGSLALAAGVISMILVAGYLKYVESRDSSRNFVNGPRMPPWPAGAMARPPMPPWPMPTSGVHFLMNMDENHDGKVNTEEATRFIRAADSDGDGFANRQDIDRMIQARFPLAFKSPMPPIVPPSQPKVESTTEPAK